MQKIILLYAVFMLLVYFSNAQDSIPVKRRIYKITATTRNQAASRFGYLLRFRILHYSFLQPAFLLKDIKALMKTIARLIIII